MPRITAAQITDFESFQVWFHSLDGGDRYKTGIALDASQVVVWLPRLADSIVETENSPEFWTWAFRVSLLIRTVRAENASEFSQPATVALHAKSERFNIIIGNEIIFALRCAGGMSRHQSAQFHELPTDLDWVKKLADQIERDGDLQWFYSNPSAIIMDKSFLQSTSVLSLKAELQRSSLTDEGLLIWWEWYESILQGRHAFGLKDRQAAEELEQAIVLGGKNGKFQQEFWEREPDEINREIAEWVAEARAAEAVGDVVSTTDQPSEDDFRSRPASVETTGKKGDVDLVNSKPTTELSDAVLRSVTIDLANGLRNLADAADEAQADKRFTSFMRNVAATVERAPDNQELLFESGRNFLALDYYSETVEEQWGVLAGQYHGLLIQFEKTLQKFEAWRQFNAEPLQPFDFAAAKEFNQEAQQAQSAFEKATWLFKPRVVESLRFLGQRFNDAVLGTATEISNGLNIPSARELLQSDLAVSLANVITSFAEAGIVRFGGKFLEGAGAAGDKAAWVAGFSAVLLVLSPVLKKFNNRYPVMFKRAKKAIAYMAKRLGIPDVES